MTLSELGSLIAKSAPLLGEIVGTVCPPAGLVISAVARLFGVNGNDPSEIANAIQSDPDHDIKLKQLELQHADALQNAKVQLRMGAYQREEAVTKATSKRDWLMDFLAVFIVISFLVLTLVVAFINLPQNTHDIFYMLLGAFAGGWSVILNYYFGASLQNKWPDPPKQQDIVLPPPAVTRR